MKEKLTINKKTTEKKLTTLTHFAYNYFLFLIFKQQQKT
jgi:hypothetical protein